MLIDCIFAILLVGAILRGYRQGLIVGLFSLLAVIIGLAASMKLSTVMAIWIGRTFSITGEWLPFIAFAVVFILAVLLIRLGAKALDRTIEVTNLGWVNKLSGIVFFVIIYTLVFSVLLFYAGQMHLLQPATIENSLTYKHIQPWGARVIGSVGELIPLFKDLYSELEDFFDNMADKIPH